MSEDPWLRAAERFDAWRAVPRLLIISMYWFFAYAWLFVVEWFMTFDWASIENEAVALALAGFPAVVLGVLTGVIGNLTKSYWQGGRDWNADK